MLILDPPPLHWTYVRLTCNFVNVNTTCTRVYARIPNFYLHVRLAAEGSLLMRWIRITAETNEYNQSERRLIHRRPVSTVIMRHVGEVWTCAELRARRATVVSQPYSLGGGAVPAVVVNSGKDAQCGGSGRRRGVYLGTSQPASWLARYANRPSFELKTLPRLNL